MFLGKVGTPLDASGRRLKSSNPKSAQKYMDLLLNMFQGNNIIKRVQNLQTKMLKSSSPLDNIEEYETLDKQITEMMLSAERRRRRATYRYAWSLKLVAAA
eukprot:3896084-Ditylum_brightwellii.AAC.1